MKALTIKQPWAWAIMSAGKDIENRNWFTNVRGTIAVHSSKKLDVAEVESYKYTVLGNEFFDYPQEVNCLWEDLICGAILGTVEIVDCVKGFNSPWFFGDYGFVLKNSKRLAEPIPFKGALGFWDIPKEIEEKINKLN
jgi:hypothetical protein